MITLNNSLIHLPCQNECDFRINKQSWIKTGQRLKEMFSTIKNSSSLPFKIKKNKTYCFPFTINTLAQYLRETVNRRYLIKIETLLRIYNFLLNDLEDWQEVELLNKLKIIVFNLSDESVKQKMAMGIIHVLIQINQYSHATDFLLNLFSPYETVWVLKKYVDFFIDEKVQYKIDFLLKDLPSVAVFDQLKIYSEACKSAHINSFSQTLTILDKLKGTDFHALSLYRTAIIILHYDVDKAIYVVQQIEAEEKRSIALKKLFKISFQQCDYRTALHIAKLLPLFLKQRALKKMCVHQRKAAMKES